MTNDAIDLDQPDFDAGDIARIAGLDQKVIANWTDRNFADPYHGPRTLKRGRGRPRRYTLRDLLRFCLMRDLTERYEIPVPLGRRICGAVFSEVFSPAKAGYLVVEGVRTDYIKTDWFANEAALADYLRTYSMKSCLVVNTAATFSGVMRELDKERANSR